MTIREEDVRTSMLIGKVGVERLRNATVALFGLGGVGSYVAEALARSGVGHLVLCDSDTVARSNINRQLIALQSTIGRKKTEVMRERIADIDPQIKVDCFDVFYSAETECQFDYPSYSYIADAIDTVSAKLLLIENANRCRIPVISAMGAGNKLHPELFELADIFKTEGCPLARVMRHELRKRGIDRLTVVYSREKPLEPIKEYALPEETGAFRRSTPASIAFVPSVAGLLMAGEIIRELAEIKC